LLNDVNTCIRALYSLLNWQPVQEVANVSKFLLAQYDTRRRIKYILQWWPEMDCADTVQDAVAVL